MLEAISRPALAAELTLQPVRRYGVDAAILFSDIVVPVAAVGFGVDVKPGVGPVVNEPFSRAADLERLRPLEADEDIPFVIDTVRILSGALDVPLIGFAGGPFTLASYLVEGGPSRTWARTKGLMRSDPATWEALLDRLRQITAASLRAQVEAGAAAVQIFDSWAGALSPTDYERYVMPTSRALLADLGELGVPRIHFALGAGELLGLIGELGADVVGVDWRVALDEAARRIGVPVALQGNLDPTVCLAPWPVVEEAVKEVLAQAAGLPGHIFNLGHGVLPETDPGVLAHLVELVHGEMT